MEKVYNLIAAINPNMAKETLPDECDFCKRVLEKEEELYPVWIGEMPEPKTHCTKATAEKSEKIMGYRTSNQSEVRKRPDTRILGRPIGDVVALMRALNYSNKISVEYRDVIEEFHSVGNKAPQAFAEVSKSKKTNHLTNSCEERKTGAEVRVEPEFERPDPDLEVCEFCKESIQN